MKGKLKKVDETLINNSFRSSVEGYIMSRGDSSAKNNYQKALNRFIDDQTDEKVRNYNNFLKKKLPDVKLDGLIEEFAETYINKEVSLNSGKRGKRDVEKKKRAPSAYNAFVGEKMKEYESGKPKDNFQKAIKEWNNLTQEAKEAYKDAYKAKKVEPENERESGSDEKQVDISSESE